MSVNEFRYYRHNYYNQYNIQTGGGLTALLPAPKGGGRELGAGRKASFSTKTMVPYTLSKRYQDSKKKTSVNKKTKPAKKNGGGDDSDSDGEGPVSFFSLDSTPSIPKPVIPSPIPDDLISEPKPESETPAQSETHPLNSVGSSQPHQYDYSNYSASHYLGTNEQYAVNTNGQYAIGTNEQYAVNTNGQYVIGTNEQYSCVQDSSLRGYSSEYPPTLVAQDTLVAQTTLVAQDSSSPAPHTERGHESSVSDAMSAVGPGLSIDQDQVKK